MRAPSAVLLTLMAAVAHSAVTLHPLFGSDMVFQQQTWAPVWGWAKPGERVSVQAGWGASASTVAGRDGRWKVMIQTVAAGGPYAVRVSGENSILLSNVMLGEVWLCSGQSNMEWPLGPIAGYDPPIQNSIQEVANATHPSLRLFTVAKATAPTPLAQCAGSWKVCDPSTVADFSATAYFFGRALQARLGVPIGLIFSAWGGTEVELWTSESALRRMPGFSEAIDRYRVANAAAQEVVDRRAQALQAETSIGWEAEDLDESQWTAAPSLQSYEAAGLEGYDGSVWYRATVSLSESQASGDAVLSLGAIDDNDDTWINGAKIGSTQQYDRPREYPVPRGVLRAGINRVAIRTVDTGGLGGFQQPELVGLHVAGDTVALSGWKMRTGLDFADFPMPPGSGRLYSVLYNGMIAPLIPFALRGTIWYQGESNVDRAYQYRTSFPNMIQNWREDWGRGEFPFYFVQIAPFAYGMNDASAELREAQRLSASTVRNSGMAVTSDLVPDIANIHPPLKQEVGARLALLALQDTYGLREVEACGPTFSSFRVVRNVLEIAFDHASGLHSAGAEALGFELAGNDRVFHAASATITGERVLLSSPEVRFPVAVRFGWHDAAKTNLFNGAGLPAGPFRSDDWPGVTDSVRW